MMNKVVLYHVEFNKWLRRNIQYIQKHRICFNF